MSRAKYVEVSKSITLQEIDTPLKTHNDFESTDSVKGNYKPPSKTTIKLSKTIRLTTTEICVKLPPEDAIRDFFNKSQVPFYELSMDILHGNLKIQNRGDAFKKSRIN